MHAARLVERLPRERWDLPLAARSPESVCFSKTCSCSGDRGGAACIYTEADLLEWADVVGS